MKYSKKILDEKYEEKVSLKLSKITVVGGEKSGKTSVVNSLMGLDFQKHYESTKGIQISEFDVHDVDSHSDESNTISFQKVEQDSSATVRASVSSYVIDSSREREECDTILQLTDIKNGKSQIEISQELYSVETNEICLMEEGRNTAKKVKESGDNTNSIRFTIHDYCGHRVFQCLHNIFLSAEGIFIVAFDMTKILHEEERGEALEHLEYWLSSIKMSALEERDKSPHLSIKNLSVILIGTHSDEFLKTSNADSISGLNFIDKTLKDILPSSVHESHHSILHPLRNHDQGLCFWPVDNSNPLDSNILKLRHILLDTAMKKYNGSDTSKEMTMNVLQAMDKLTELSKVQPFIPICNSSDTVDTPSVMQVMSDCGIFDMDQTSTDKNKEVCMELLKRFHCMGQLIYLHQIPALQEYCILDPQWLINMITYIVRDFRYHWFLRDRSAIELHGGKPWNRLKDDGILEMSLLRRLWIGSHDQIDFLTHFLVEVGILGECAHFYTVPLLRAIPSEHSLKVSKKELDKYFSYPRVVGEINLPEHNFALIPFYSSLTNALTTDTVEPIILPSGCIFRCLQTGHEFAFLLDPAKKGIFIVSSCNRWNFSSIKKLVEGKCKSVNQRFYKNRLKIAMKGNVWNSIYVTCVQVALFFAFIAVLVIGFDNFHKKSSDHGGQLEKLDIIMKNDDPKDLSVLDISLIPSLEPALLSSLELTSVPSSMPSHISIGSIDVTSNDIPSATSSPSRRRRESNSPSDIPSATSSPSSMPSYVITPTIGNSVGRKSGGKGYSSRSGKGKGYSSNNSKGKGSTYSSPTSSSHNDGRNDSAPVSTPAGTPQNVPMSTPVLSPSLVDTPSSEPSDVPSDQPSSVPSSMASDIPSVLPSSESYEPSLLPSYEPSSFPTECEDEEDWRVGGESEYAGIKCTQLISEENWCDAIWELNDHAFNGKGVKEACCACQRNRFTSTYPSTAPSSKPSISIRPSVISESPSATPSSQTSDCIDEPNWFFNEDKGLGCTAITEEAETFCDQFSSIWYKNKNTYLACCACGGGRHQFVAPSSLPTSLQSVLPSAKPTLSFIPTHDVTQFTSTGTDPAFSMSPSSYPSNEDRGTAFDGEDCNHSSDCWGEFSMCKEKVCRARDDRSHPVGEKQTKSGEAKKGMKVVVYSAGNSQSYNSNQNSNPKISHDNVKNSFQSTTTSSTSSKTVETPSEFASVMHCESGCTPSLFTKFSKYLFAAFTLVILNGMYFLWMFKRRLDKQPTLNHRKEMSCDCTPSSENAVESESKFEQQLEEDTVFMDQYNSLVHAFKTVFDSARAKELAKIILTAYNDASISTLQHCYHNNSTAFMQETLPELGISSVFDRQNICSAISKLGPPPTPTNCMIACIDEHEYMREQKVIRHNMYFSNYFVHFVDMNGNWQYDVFRHYEMDVNNSTLLHFGTHSKTLDQETLGHVFNDKRVQDQTKCCVINSCESDEVMRIVKSALPNECLIYWETEVDEEAAIRFAKEFYGILSANESNSLAFRYAFEKAKKLMESHNFVFTDITADSKRIYSGSKTVAGVLKFWSQEDRERETYEAKHASISSHSNKRKKIDIDDVCKEATFEEGNTSIAGVATMRKQTYQDWGNDNAITSRPSSSFTATGSKVSEEKKSPPDESPTRIGYGGISVQSSTSGSSEASTQILSSTELRIGLDEKGNNDTTRVYYTSKSTNQYCQQRFKFIFTCCDHTVEHDSGCKFMENYREEHATAQKFVKTRDCTRTKKYCGACGMIVCDKSKHDGKTCQQIHRCNMKGDYIYEVKVKHECLSHCYAKRRKYISTTYPDAMIHQHLHYQPFNTNVPAFCTPFQSLQRSVPPEVSEDMFIQPLSNAVGNDLCRQSNQDNLEPHLDMNIETGSHFDFDSQWDTIDGFLDESETNDGN